MFKRYSCWFRNFVRWHCVSSLFDNTISYNFMLRTSLFLNDAKSQFFYTLTSHVTRPLSLHIINVLVFSIRFFFWILRAHIGILNQLFLSRLAKPLNWMIEEKSEMYRYMNQNQKPNSSPMGHIAHLWKQFKSINTFEKSFNYHKID